MPGKHLTTASTILCPHGGQAILVTANQRVKADGAQVLLETDVHPIAGCPFTIGPKYSPCIRIQWAAGAARGRVNGTPVLVDSSIGQCFNAEGALQGIAVVGNRQLRVSNR